MDLCGAIAGLWTEQSFLSPCQVDTAAGYKNLTERQDLPPRWEEATIPIAFSPSPCMASEEIKSRKNTMKTE